MTEEYVIPSAISLHVNKRSYNRFRRLWQASFWAYFLDIRYVTTKVFSGRSFKQNTSVIKSPSPYFYNWRGSN